MITASFIPDDAERPRVLLADDHPAMLALTAGVLSGECFVVGSVGDGCELLAEAERLHPDVIVRAGCARSSCFSACMNNDSHQLALQLTPPLIS